MSQYSFYFVMSLYKPYNKDNKYYIILYIYLCNYLWCKLYVLASRNLLYFKLYLICDQIFSHRTFLNVFNILLWQHTLVSHEHVHQAFIPVLGNICSVEVCLMILVKTLWQQLISIENVWASLYHLYDIVYIKSVLICQ